MADVQRNFEDMSREELLNYLGEDADPAATRDELISIAISRDSDAGMMAS